jgi:hypothetical protein
MPSAIRHARHDSATNNTPPPPKRSSSFKGVLNAYYKIFGGHPPKKAPRNESRADETERLRQTVKKYEEQLEEASNTLLLQDKVLASWEKQGWKIKKVRMFNDFNVVVYIKYLLVESKLNIIIGRHPERCAGG